MDVQDQVEKLLQQSPFPQIHPHPPAPVATEHIGESASESLSKILGSFPAFSDSFAVGPLTEFLGSLSAMSTQELFESSSILKQSLPAYGDEWTNGFVESSWLEKEHLRQAIYTAQTHGEIIQALSQNNLETYASAYQSYLVDREKNLDEDESPNIIFQSLQSWALFVADYTKLRVLPAAEISADLDGCLEMEWRLSSDESVHDPYNEFYGNGRGLAVLTFYPGSLNHLSILSGSYASAKQRITLDCFLPHEMTMQVFDFFTERLLNPNADL